MTKDKDLKRQVRDRASRTGERYAAARAQLVAAREGSDVLAGLAFTHHEILEGPVRGWWHEFRPLLEDLTDDEYLWEPAPGSLTVRRRRSGVVRDHPHELTAPLATVGWHVAAMTHLLRMRTDAHRGERRLTWAELETADRAARGLQLLDEAYDGWVKLLVDAEPSMLARPSEGPPRMIDGQFPFIQVIFHTSQLLLPAVGQIQMVRRLYELRSS